MWMLGVISIAIMAIGALTFIYGFFTKGLRRMGRGLLTLVIGVILFGVSYFGVVISTPR